VITHDDALRLSENVLKLTSARTAAVRLMHTVQSLTELASGRVRRTNDGDKLWLSFIGSYGEERGTAVMHTNQVDDATLRTLVQSAEILGEGFIGSDAPLTVHQWNEQDAYAPVTIWRDPTAQALQTARRTAIPLILDPARRGNHAISGFLGVTAQADVVLTKAGISAYSRETDSELALTARSADTGNTGANRDVRVSGWSGAATRDFAQLDPARIVTEAVDLCERGKNPSAVEPGRRTAILAPTAVVHLMRFFAFHFSGFYSDIGETGFSKVPGQKRGNKWKQQLFDRRVTVTSDPSDVEGGFCPWFGPGLASHPTTWVDRGVLTSLSYGEQALLHRKPYQEMPLGFRLHGGDTTVEQMVASCDDGVYVHRFSSVDTLDWRSGMMTGVTSDGCFLVRHGKIERPITNLRFLMSPFHVLANIIAIGPTHRAAYGYAPWTRQEENRGAGVSHDWPRRPMVVPPLMVRDFNFNATADAV